MAQDIKVNAAFYTLTNRNGMWLKLTDYGAALVSCFVPAKNGGLIDVALGFDDISGYINHDAYFGVTAGRVANRIENAEFTLDGKLYRLFANDGRNHLHGGKRGFDKIIWNTKISGSQAVFSLTSPDGDEGYPGNLSVKTIYSMTDDNSVVIDYEYSVSGKATPVNLTNHAYFNLNGQDGGTVGGHYMQIWADSFVCSNAEAIPSGEIKPVDGTPMDFRSAKRIDCGWDSDFWQIRNTRGYDASWVLPNDGRMKKAAACRSDVTGIALTVSTDYPCIHFYSGNNMPEQISGKNGVIYPYRGGFCLEAQYYPNSLAHAHFPSPVIKPGEVKRHRIVYGFSVE